MIFNTTEQDEAYEKLLAERKFWVYKKDLFSKTEITEYTLNKIEPEIMKLDNSYDLIRRVNQRLKNIITQGSRCFYIFIMIHKRKEHKMNNLKRRKLNTLYLTLTTIAVCMAIMTSIEISRIFGVLIGVLMIIFVQFDERSEYSFPDMEVEDE